MRIGPHKKISVNGFFWENAFLSVGTFVDFYKMIPWLALTRATFISTHSSQRRLYILVRVNALSRATLISTNRTALHMGRINNGTVSMPSLGQLSFLQWKIILVRRWMGVSMPSLGQHSFLQANLDCLPKVYYVSMLSHGQHSFLRFQKENRSRWWNVSMPSHGQHSFLQKISFLAKCTR